MFAWGSNNTGQLPPREALEAHAISSVACGSHHTLVVRADGTVQTLGRNEEGQVRPASPRDRPATHAVY